MKELEKLAIVGNFLDNHTIISGKVFDKEKKEIRNVGQYIAKRYREKQGIPLLDSDLKSIVASIFNYSEIGLWEELPLVKKARHLGACDDALPFDLDNKQLQIINILLFHPKEEVMFLVTGIGGSGKSTFLNIVKQLFDNDTCSIPLNELQGYNVAEAVKHRLICSDELGKGEMNNKVLKVIVSKQKLFVEPKFMNGYEVDTQSSILYCMNKDQRIDVTDSGILRRVVYYERNTKIKNPNIELKDKVYSEEELLCILRNALRFENKDWKDDFIEETHFHLMKDNSVYKFINIEYYDTYVDCCCRYGLKPYSEPNWREIRELFLRWQIDDARRIANKPIDIPSFL